MYGSSALRGLIPKSSGGRIGLGLGAGALGAGVMAMRSRRSSGSRMPPAGPQKHYEWQREGGFTDAQAKDWVSSRFPGYDTSTLRM